MAAEGQQAGEVAGSYMGSQRLPWITIAWGAYMVVSASFMLQVNLWLTAKVGDSALEWAFRIAAATILIAVYTYCIRRRLGVLSIVCAAIIFSLFYLTGLSDRYFAERTHLMTYGLLGYLSAGDMIRPPCRSAATGLFLAIAFVALISGLDEGFQRLLPYRFGEIKDFVTNIMAGALGAALFIVLSTDHESKSKKSA